MLLFVLFNHPGKHYIIKSSRAVCVVSLLVDDLTVRSLLYLHFLQAVSTVVVGFA